MVRTFFFVNLLVVCWLWMQIVHELGHVLGALTTGATVERVELHPLAISRTQAYGGTAPLVVVWSGPVAGCVAPVVAWLIAHCARWSYAYMFRFFAGFCLIANGAYLAGGSFDGIGDCGDLLKLGTPLSLLWLFGAVTIPAGLVTWHRLGIHFGLGRQAQPLDRRAVAIVAGILLLTIAAELVWTWL